MTAPARFRMGDVQRAINAAKKCGYQNVRVLIGMDGRIEVIVSETPTSGKEVELR